MEVQPSKELYIKQCLVLHREQEQIACKKKAGRVAGLS